MMKNVFIGFIAIFTILLATVTASSIKPSLSLIPSEISSKYHNVTFEHVKTTDGSTVLIADIAPTQSPKNVAILICYPDSGNIKKWLGYGLVLADMGYRIIMFDYRGFGKSQHFDISPNVLYYDEFIQDARAAYGYMAATYPTYRKGLFGLSMGSIIATELALEMKGEFIIGDSYVADLDTTATRIQQLYRRELILPRSSIDYNKDINRLHIPMLLFSGKYDLICPPDSLQHISQLEPQVVIYNGSNLEGPKALKMAYFEKIDEFIAKTIAGKPSDSTPKLTIQLILLTALTSLIFFGYVMLVKQQKLK